MSITLRTVTFSALLFAASAATAQDLRPVAFTNARLHTIAGDCIERGTLVVRNGKIEAVGVDAVVPAGARIIDCAGKTLMPGLVSAVSRAGLERNAPSQLPEGLSQRGRRSPPIQLPVSSGGSAQDQAATKVVDGLYPKQEVFGELLRMGITSLALNPRGMAFPGLGAVLRPDGKNAASLTANDAAFVQIAVGADGATKKLLKDSFAAAATVLKARKAPPPPKEEPKKPEEAKPAEKPAEKPEQSPAEKPGDKPGDKPPAPQPPAPQPTPAPATQPTPAPARPAPPKNPNHELLADLLDGKQRALVEIGSANAMLHWQHAFDKVPEFPHTIVVSGHDTQSGTIDLVLDQLKAQKAAVLLPPILAALPRSRVLTHPAKQLHDAGIEIGFLLGDAPSVVEGTFFRMMELVRAGLPANIALRGITLVPAKALGIDKEVGSLEVGKLANLLVFDGDPLDPASRLAAVWLQGQAVPEKQ